MASAEEYRAPKDIDRLRTIALGAGGIGLIAWLIGLYFDPEQALRSWLLAFIFWSGLCFGSIAILMLQYLTGGAWGVMIRRVAEACTRTFPLVFVFFLPLAFGVTRLYEWTHLPADDHVIQHRGWFMTPESWILRSAIYFIVFGVAIYLLNRWSTEQDKSDNFADAAKWLGIPTAFSGPAIVFIVLTITFAAVDWVMMLDPHWFSTIWGLLYLIGWGLGTLCFAVIVLAYLSDRSPLNAVLGRRHFHDLGKLMLAFVMVWTYFNLSQFLIIWSGNIPEETGWYLSRMKGGWGYVAWGLVIFHFAVPFLVLLMQDLKRRPRTLALVAVFILIMRLIDIFFHIGPSPRIDTHGLGQGAFIISWMDLVAPIAAGGIWLWYFFGQLKKRPLVPVMDPFLENAIHHGKGH
jgi:hypothetical protein